MRTHTHTASADSRRQGACQAQYVSGQATQHSCRTTRNLGRACAAHAKLLGRTRGSVWAPTPFVLPCRPRQQRPPHLCPRAQPVHCNQSLRSLFPRHVISPREGGEHGNQESLVPPSLTSAVSLRPQTGGAAVARCVVGSPVVACPGALQLRQKIACGTRLEKRLLALPPQGRGRHG